MHNNLKFREAMRFIREYGACLIFIWLYLLGGSEEYFSKYTFSFACKNIHV